MQKLILIKYQIFSYTFVEEKCIKHQYMEMEKEKIISSKYNKSKPLNYKVKNLKVKGIIL